MYAEPFFGAGAVTGLLLSRLSSKTALWLNDKDYWLICLWKTVLEEPEGLLRRITAFTPSADAFYQYKQQDGERIDPVEAGFRKIVLHQTSYSGLGVMAGGPLGGRAQNNSRYNPLCRWRPSNLKNAIRAWHRALKRFRTVTVTCRDFRDVLKSLSANAFVYLDPPYYLKGSQLYKYTMSDEDHAALCAELKSAAFDWLLSYDDHPRIRELYAWARIDAVFITYTTARARLRKRPKNQEIIISPHGLVQ